MGVTVHASDTTACGFGATLINIYLMSGGVSHLLVQLTLFVGLGPYGGQGLE